MTEHEDAQQPPTGRPQQDSPYGPPPGAFGSPPPAPPDAPPQHSAYAASPGVFGPPPQGPYPLQAPPQYSPYGPPPASPPPLGPQHSPYGPPVSPYGPPPPLPPGQGRRLLPAGRRGRLLLFGGVGVLITGLLAGLLAWNGSSGSEEPEAKRDLEPFRQAVAALADVPGLRYQDSGADLRKRDVTVTASGSRFGTTGFGDAEADREILHIGGRTFTRQKDPAPGTESGEGASGKWAAAEESDSVTQEAVKRRPSPPDLATKLSKALDELEDTPVPSEPAKPPAVNGTPALAVDTSAGRLLVTEKKPHRVLRLESYDPSRSAEPSGGSAHSASVRLTPAAAQGDSEDEDPSEIPEVTDGPLEGSDSEALDLAPVTGDAVDPMFDSLEKQTKELNNATDSGITLALSGSGTVTCSSGGCTASHSFAGQITTSAKSRLMDGKVTAVMTASFSIDSKPAGRCTSPQSSFAVTGTGVSGSLSCSNPGAGPTFASVEAQKKAEAQARSRANGGRPVQYRIPYRADTLITARALATTEVKKLVDKVRQERDDIGCKLRSSVSGAGTRWGGAAKPLGLRHAAVHVHRPPTRAEPVADSAKCSDEKFVSAANKITERATEGKVRKSNNYHPHFSDERVMEILKNPDAVYLSQGKRGNLIFRKGEDIVVTKGPGAGVGDVITGYGPSGKKGKSGAEALGGSPDDPGPPVTHEDIVNGKIPDTKGGYMQPARRIR